MPPGPLDPFVDPSGVLVRGSRSMLSGYRILDCTDGGAGLCGQMLADLGAEVILVEPRGGAPSRHVGPYAGDVEDPNRSLQFWATHRNKRSVALDLDRARDRERFEVLALESDAVVESFPPGHLDALAIGPVALRRRDPKLIVVSITPFGQSGPHAHWAATDLTVTAASGQLILCGDEDRAPLASVVPQAFLHAGAEAATGTLLALAARERDGVGQHVDVSAQTAMMLATQSMVLNHGWRDTEIQRLSGGIRLGELRIRFVYPCRDGHVNFTFLFGPALGPATRRMFEWMHEEGFCDAALRDKDWLRYPALLLSGEEPLEELERATRAIESFTRAHTKLELYRGAFERRVWMVPVSDVADLARSPQLEAREFWQTLEHEDLGLGVRYPGPFAHFERTPIRIERRPPRLDEDAGADFDDAGERPTAQAKPDFRARAGASEAALSGLRVLDFTWVFAGPAITRTLADHGATVVRIETAARIDALRAGQPFLDGEAGYERSGGYANCNAGKLGLALNLNQPGARELALKLVDWADVVVENFSPKAMAAWGLDWESLRRRRPDLVMLSTCLNGQTGPDRMLAGYGTMGAAIAGFGQLTGWPDRDPSGPFLAYTDYVSPRFATAALLAALEHRRRTGEGQHVDCAQAECCVHFLAPAVLDHAVNGRVWSGRGNAHLQHAPSGVYPCAGIDRWLALAAPDEGSWGALCDVAEPAWARDPRFATAADRLANRERLDAAIASFTKGLDVGDLEARLQAAGIPAHRASTSADAFADPQLQARGHFALVEHPELGTIPLESTRIRLSRTPAVAARHGPMVGEDNERVLREILELDDDAVTELIVSGALE